MSIRCSIVLVLSMCRRLWILDRNNYFLIKGHENTYSFDKLFLIIRKLSLIVWSIVTLTAAINPPKLHVCKKTVQIIKQSNRIRFWVKLYVEDKLHSIEFSVLIQHPEYVSIEQSCWVFLNAELHNVCITNSKWIFRVYFGFVGWPWSMITVDMSRVYSAFCWLQSFTEVITELFWIGWENVLGLGLCFKNQSDIKLLCIRLAWRTSVK